MITTDEEWQSLTCHDTSRRSMGRRLSRRGEISPIRIRTVPDETLQNQPAKSLSGLCTFNYEIFSEILQFIQR